MARVFAAVVAFVTFLVVLLLVVGNKGDAFTAFAVLSIFAFAAALLALLISQFVARRDNYSAQAVVGVLTGAGAVLALLLTLQVMDIAGSERAQNKRLEDGRIVFEEAIAAGFPKIDDAEIASENYQLDYGPSAHLLVKMSAPQLCQELDGRLGSDWQRVRLGDGCWMARNRQGSLNLIRVDSRSPGARAAYMVSADPARLRYYFVERFLSNVKAGKPDAQQFLHPDYAAKLEATGGVLGWFKKHELTVGKVNMNPSVSALSQRIGDQELLISTSHEPLPRITKLEVQPADRSNLTSR